MARCARSPADLERNRLAGSDLESRLGILAEDDAGGYARMWVIADDGNTKGSCTQEIGGPIAVDANQVRHDVCRAPFRAIHQQRHARRVTLRSRRLRNDGIRRILRGPDFGDADQLKTLLLNT